MRKALALLIAALAAPAVAGAGEFEVAGHLGYTFPFYSQTLSYDPGPVTVPIPGVTVEQNGEFQLKASGGLAFAGGATFYPITGIGIELRIDSADVTVDTQSASYNVRVGLPAPLEPVVANLTLTKGKADVKALTPISLNLKLRTGGSFGLMASGGISRLPKVEFSIEQTVGLGVSAFNLSTGNIEVSTLGFRGTSSAEGKSAWGGNLGLGVQIKLGERGALLVEGRGFYFPKQTITWEPNVDRTLNAIEQALLARVQQKLEPIEFKPWWVQATVGVAIRF
jgi:hypothetical protein